LVPDIFLLTLKTFKDEINELKIDISQYDLTDSNNTDFSTGFNLTPKEKDKLKLFFDLKE
jgi:hypothetical protein